MPLNGWETIKNFSFENLIIILQHFTDEHNSRYLKCRVNTKTVKQWFDDDSCCKNRFHYEKASLFLIWNITKALVLSKCPLVTVLANRHIWISPISFHAFNIYFHGGVPSLIVSFLFRTDDKPATKNSGMFSNDNFHFLRGRRGSRHRHF